MKMKTLAAIAVLLVIIWIVLRLALAITSGLLHVLWIAAIILALMWVWDKFRGKNRKV